MSVVTGISFGVFEQNIHIPLDERGLPLNRKHCSVIDTGKLITFFFVCLFFYKYSQHVFSKMRKYLLNDGNA